MWDDARAAEKFINLPQKAAPEAAWAAEHWPTHTSGPEPLVSCDNSHQNLVKSFNDLEHILQHIKPFKCSTFFIYKN